MKTFKKYIAICVAISIVSILFVSCKNQPSNVNNSSKPVDVQQISTSFSRGYFNIGALTSTSEKIAVVKVLDDGVCENIDGIICTENQVQVIRPIYNCEEGDIIEHLTPGGTVDGVCHKVNQVEQLEKDGEYLLFMEKEGTGRYIEPNHNMGRFTYNDGKVTSVYYSASYAANNGANGIQCISDYDLDPIIDMVSRIVSQPETMSEYTHEYKTIDIPVTQYSSWELLKADSNLICAVTIDSYNNGKNEEPKYDGRYFKASVDKVYFGDFNKDTINLTTLNSQSDVEGLPNIYEMIDDPWMEKGQKYLVFLSKEENDFYNVLGLSQGRFAITDNKITSLKNVYPTRIKEGLDIKDLPLASWETDVLNKLN